MQRYASFASIGRVCRLGLATRGDTSLKASDVRHAIDRGINYLNWCGHPDGLCQAVRELGPHRASVRVAVQLDATTGRQAAVKLDKLLTHLGSDYVDVVTYYYVERDQEWQAIIGPNGAHEAMERARRAGKVRLVGVTTHQRALATRIAESEHIDVLMIRYNAAHRGAEDQVFPVTDRLRLPVVAYTGIRWGALLRTTPDDPAGFVPPSPVDCYRFVLANPSVSVALMAPHDRRQLDEDLRLLEDWRGCTPPERARLIAHGDRVHRHAGRFP